MHCGQIICDIGKTLEEYANVYIHKPTLGLYVDGVMKFIDTQNKLFLQYNTRVTKCIGFNGPKNYFAFANFQDLIDKVIPSTISFETNLKKAEGNADCHHRRRPTAALQLPSAPTEAHRSFVASSFGLAKPQRSSLFPSFSSFFAVPNDHIVAHRRRKPTAPRSPSITVDHRRRSSLLRCLRRCYCCYRFGDVIFNGGSGVLQYLLHRRREIRSVADWMVDVKESSTGDND
ncbi:unnamed protein product [Lactuca virosa]|uniref:Uncharacterized protein n=1 Tax=Lactuca virosa TaxID=75947 RepID=A0AAU9NZ87_9ASTR|nr:unnamed protein product [Lactuca virosa]